MSNKSTKNSADGAGDTQNVPDEEEEEKEKHMEEKEKEEEEEEDEDEEEQEDEEEAEEEQDVEIDEEEDREEEEVDIHDVYENGEEHDFNQLYRAVRDENITAVRRLLESSLNVNVLDTNKSVRSQLYKIVKELLYKSDDVDPRNAFVQTSNGVAPENGNAQKLLERNADANIASYLCYTSRPIIAGKGCAEIVKALIDSVGGVNAIDKNGDTPLHLAARNDHKALAEILHNQSTKGDARSHLRLNVHQDNPVELELLQQPNRNEADVGQIPHHVATLCAYFEMKTNLLSHHPNVNAGSTRDVLPLRSRVIAEREHAEIVENLILNGANVNACNNAKMTPLHLACENGHISIVGILLDNHATVDVKRQAQKTPFCLAAENGHADVVDVLLSRGICEFVMKDSETPLHFAAKWCNTKVFEVILKHSRRIYDKLTNDEQKLQEIANDFTVERDITPIKLIKRDGRRVYAGIVWTEHGIPLETMLDSEGYTALDHAVESIQPKIVKLLLSEERCVYSDQNLDNSFRRMIFKIGLPDFQYRNLIKREHKEIIDIMEILCYEIHHQMTCNNIKEIARVLMNSREFNVNYQKYELNTLLHTVIKHCESNIYPHHANKSRPLRLRIQTIDDVLQLLLEKGADFNMKNTYGETPLMIASEGDCCHAIQKLFDWEQKSGLKLDLDARDQYGATALIKAAESNDVSAMRLLLSHKASVNLHDYYGFTALHAAVYEPNRNWFDLHFFCKGFLMRKSHYIEKYRKSFGRGQLSWRDLTVNPITSIDKLDEHLAHDEKTTRFKEEMVRLLLADHELNVNAIDFRGNTPLDLGVKFYERITLETFKALKDRDAIHNSLEPMDEAPVEIARVDKRGRGPLHRLIISLVSNHVVDDMKDVKVTKGITSETHERFELMVVLIILRPENFRESANATDDKGRTPLHYAVMPPDYFGDGPRDLARVLLKIGSKVNAVDIYGKTPLHYAEMDLQYDLLIEYGADERKKDKNGHTPRDLRQLRKSVIINKKNAKKLEIRKYSLYASTYKPFESVINNDRAIESSKRKLAEALRIYSQSHHPKESSDRAIWQIWIENGFLNLNRRISKLKPSVQRFIDRLADGIKLKDRRFECQSRLVGSADEETKAVFSTDFDFNFRLTKFCEECDIFPHPLGPKGYFQLRRKTGNSAKRQNDAEFDCFFNSDQCLIASEVNSRFQITLEHVLQDPNFWQDEHLFDWNLTDIEEEIKSAKPAGLCKTVRLRMINPIADGEGGFLFVNVSIDVAACVHVEDSCFGDQLPVDIDPIGTADCCTLVFDRPCFDPSKPRGTPSMFSDTYSRISFAPLESRIIRESSPLIKAAYTVCKLILYENPKTTYQLKTSLFFCMEALKIRERCEGKDGDKFTQRELAFWVERLMFCFSEFHRHDVYPCYFMPSFKHRVEKLVDYYDPDEEHPNFKNGSFFGFAIPLAYSKAFDIYFNLCPDDTTIDIPTSHAIVATYFHEGGLIVNDDPNWEQFDREEFIKKLAARNPSY